MGVGSAVGIIDDALRLHSIPCPATRLLAKKLTLRFRSIVLLAMDTVLVSAAWAIAFWLRFNLEIPDEFAGIALQALPVAIASYLLALTGVGVHRQVWRFVALTELRQLALGVGIGGVLTAGAVLMFRLPNFPRSVLLLHPVIVLMMLVAIRATSRTAYERSMVSRGTRPLLVVGSLQEAADALRALKGSLQWRPVGILSPLAAEQGRSLQQVPVLGLAGDLATVSRSAEIDTVLLASPPGSPVRREVLLHAADAHMTLLTLPRPDQWLQPESSGPRRVELDDLLGREPVQLNVAGLAQLLSGQTVAVTGAGGSIGSELCRQIARFGTARLVCIDVSEFNIYQLEQELRQSHPQMQGLYYTANVREPERLHAILCRHRPAVVFHAAAYKHVPLMEEGNEIEALRTNAAGTLNAARAAAACGARRFVLISTDKAVNPANVMGASKRLAELLVQAVAAQDPRTQFVSVRFGNVLGSSGSVVPLFTEQIKRGGPVTVTHPDIVRYFMTIPEAAQLVLQAGLMGQSGQIFVLDMGQPVKIAELARMLIRLSGKTEEEIPISYIGLRPGEKLYEELLADDETTEPTPHAKLRIAKTAGPLPDVEQVVGWIAQVGPAPEAAVVRAWLKQQVPEYTPP
jgi:FlaA1/EpsC-like NDP-sugar epimerase